MDEPRFHVQRKLGARWIDIYVTQNEHAANRYIRLRWAAVSKDKYRIVREQEAERDD